MNLIEHREELEHAILEAEDVREVILSKIGEINAFIGLWEKSKATMTVSQSCDSGMSETQGKDNPQTTRQSLNLDAQVFTTPFIIVIVCASILCVDDSVVS